MRSLQPSPIRFPIMLLVAAIVASSPSASAQQIPCETLLYYNTGAQDYIFTQNLPTVWWAVRMTPTWSYDARVDSAYVSFGIEKHNSLMYFDTLDVRVLADTLPTIRILDSYSALLPYDINGNVQDGSWVVEFAFDMTTATIPVGKDFWIAWRLKGQQSDIGRIFMKYPAQAKDRSVVIAANGTTVTATDYVASSSMTDSVDLVAEGHVCYPTAVPVELASLSGSWVNDAALLDWVTASESGNAGFAIERLSSRSESGRISVWKKIGFVQGHGTSTESHQYAFVDPDAAGAMGDDGIVRYRLAQIDFDGRTQRSPVVEIAVPTTAPGLELRPCYPNPVSAHGAPATIGFTLEVPSAARLEVYDLLGRVVRILADDTYAAGTHSVTFNVTGLAPGSYLYTLDAAGRHLARRVTIIE